MNQELSGILNINKPSGMTSHDVVLRVRKITAQKKVGHAGTLDPMATGVLLICLGQATRVSEYLLDSDKVYLARIHLGITTDTYDTEGEITSQAEVNVTRAQVEAELARWVGSWEQTPPMYSAVKHRGTPLYRLARRSKAAFGQAGVINLPNHQQIVAQKTRTVQIYALTLTAWAPPQLEVEVRCSKGTYIRSLAHELGQRLGCGAYLAGLVRTASGRFHLEQAVTLEELERAFSCGEGVHLLQPLDWALQAFPAVVVDQITARKVAFGQRIQMSEAAQANTCRAYGPDGHLLALLQRDADGWWRPHKVFKSPYGQTNDAHHP